MSSLPVPTVDWFCSRQYREQWDLFQSLARQVYSARGCDAALSWLDGVSGQGDVYFCIVSRRGEPLGGFSVRRFSVEDLPALRCWSDPVPVTACLRDVIGSVPQVAEASTAWSVDRSVSAALAAQASAALSVTHCRWMVATSAQHLSTVT